MAEKAFRGYLEMPPDIQLVGALSEEQVILESIRTKFDQPGVEQTLGSLILAKRLPVTPAAAAVELITFDLMAPEGQIAGKFDNEIRLDSTDSFTILEWGLFLGYATTPSPDVPTQGVDMLLAGPNPASIAVGITDAMFWAFQRSRLIIKADTVEYIASADNIRSRRVGTSQQGLDPGGGTVYSADAWGADHGMSKMRPSITVSGSFKNSIQIQLPRSTVTGGVTDTLTFMATLVFRGYLNQGGAQFRTANG